MKRKSKQQTHLNDDENLNIPSSSISDQNKPFNTNQFINKSFKPTIIFNDQINKQNSTDEKQIDCFIQKNLQQYQKKEDHQKVPNIFSIIKNDDSNSQNEEVETIEQQSKKTDDNSDLNSCVKFLDSISTKDLVNRKQQTNLSHIQREILQEEQDFFNILKNHYKNSPSNQSILIHPGVVYLIKKVGSLRGDTDKLQKLIQNYKKSISKVTNKKRLNQNLVLQKKALDEYLEKLNDKYLSADSVESSNLNSCGLDLADISAKDLLGDKRYLTNLTDIQREILPEELDFYNVLKNHYNNLPSEQSIFSHPGVEFIIQKVGSFRGDTVKLQQLKESYNKSIEEELKKKPIFQDDLDILVLLRNALDDYLTILIDKILSANSDANGKELTNSNYQKHPEQMIRENMRITRKQSKKIQSNQINSIHYNQTVNLKNNELESTNQLVPLTQEQLMLINLDQKKQVDFYEKRYQTKPNDIFFTSSTNKQISIQEEQLIEDIFKQNNISKIKQSRRMLNIPSGNGRLNYIFQKYFDTIDCLDLCKQAINQLNLNIKNQSNGYNIGILYQNSIQNWSPNNQDILYDLIWCNYGFSFLNGEQSISFLEKVQKSLKSDGYFIIKEVVAEEENCAALYFKDEERVFRTVDEYKDDIEDFFHIKEFQKFEIKKKGQTDQTYRAEGIFILQLKESQMQKDLLKKVNHF